MMRLGCAATELLLERRSPALSEAERLRVETHLAECEDCRREHGAMLSLRELVDHKAETSAKGSVQDRAIARALLKAGAPTTAAPKVAISRLPRLAWGALAIALLALVALGVSRRFTRQEAALPVAQAAPDRIEAGTLTVDGQKLGVGQGVPSERELGQVSAARLQLAHATLAIEKAEALRWSPHKRSVELREATVEVEVDPTQHRSFEIVTPHFIVQVLGTHFRVELDTVSVERGRVRIVSRQGGPLAELGAGQRWTFTPEPTHGASPEAPASEPRKPAPAAEVASTKEHAPQLSSADLLTRARHRLASGDAKGARQDLDTLLASGSATSQAELYMLRGDCSLVEGDATGAVRQYLEVRRRFAGSRAAETALFAAARVESNRGSKATAKKLLLEYRQQYPKGQFRSDVDARLKMLE